MRRPREKNWLLPLALLLSQVTLASFQLDRQEALSELVAANGKFGLALYRELIRSSGGDNVIFSPISVSLAMGLTYAGARGNTATEMSKDNAIDGRLCTICSSGRALSERKRRCFASSDVNSNVHGQFRELLSALNGRSKSPTYNLRVANRLFFAHGFQVRRSFRTFLHPQLPRLREAPQLRR
ncbi:hypothetical protein NP493_484g02013 [Ridgeia piscesae]|uniref:Serpin domain-containing protein n=1 Tax=Ridgeia piscesae TaxID=27915 RepID=A0AAD9KXI9_RIDPI|nr:hypothetical protein NP493_484g02013 [Ridgeia piscesae]